MMIYLDEVLGTQWRVFRVISDGEDDLGGYVNGRTIHIATFDNQNEATKFMFSKSDEEKGIRGHEVRWRVEPYELRNVVTTEWVRPSLARMFKGE
jgi:hypothetical protein